MFYNIKHITSFLKIKPCDMYLIADREWLLEQLRRKVEGSCTPEFGYIIKVIREEGEAQGDGVPSNAEVMEDGNIRISISYEALAFKPVVNQVMDVFVSKIEDGFILATAGPAEVKIFEENITGNWKYENQVYRDKTSQQVIKPDSKLRIIIGQLDISSNKQMYITGKMNHDECGLIDDEDQEQY